MNTIGSFETYRNLEFVPELGQLLKIRFVQVGNFDMQAFGKIFQCVYPWDYLIVRYPVHRGFWYTCHDFYLSGRQVSLVHNIAQ